jgi:hypothetical protein
LTTLEAPSPHHPLLVARTAETPATGTRVTHRGVFFTIARRSLPQLAEATVVPALLFYLFLVAIGAGAAMIAVLCWTYGAFARRIARGVRPPGVLMLATFGLTCRTVVGLVSGSTFAYFVQPVATAVMLAVIFAGSVAMRRPLVARLANDFCPLAPDVACRPAVTRLFVGLTLLWALVHLLTAAATLTMLITMPVAPFLAAKTVTCIAITVGAIVVTIAWSIRTARREHLVFCGRPV